MKIFGTIVTGAVLSCLLEACGGGGTSSGETDAFSQSHPVALNAGPLADVAVPTSRRAAARTPDATSFLNWAESAYPNYFPSAQSNKTLDIWTYRYYPQTDIYLGTNTSGDVLGLVGMGGGAYNSIPLGKITDFGCSVYPSDCAPIKTTIAFDTLIGGWKGIANSKSFSSDSLKLSVSISGNVLTISAEQFFDGTCRYTANLNPAHDSIGAGSYQCSDFTSGSWNLIDMLRVDQGDVYISLQKDGNATKRLYGMAQVGANSIKVIPDQISKLAGTYDAIATGGPFGTDTASSTKIVVNGTALTITVPYFFGGACEYSATIQADGRSISTPTYRCADFSTGTWSLNDFRAVGVNDFFLSINQNGVLKRVYGIR